MLSHFRKIGLSTGLRFLPIGICVAFAVIVLIVIFSFRNTNKSLEETAQEQIDRVLLHSKTGRSLVLLLSDIHLLSHTFYQNPSHLKSEGERLLSETQKLVAQTSNPQLKQSLAALNREMKIFLEQCAKVNRVLEQRKKYYLELHFTLTELGEVVAERTIESKLAGRDLAFIEQTALLISDYRQALLRVGELNTVKRIKNYFPSESGVPDPVLKPLESLALKLRALLDAPAPIDKYGQTLIALVVRYREVSLDYAKASKSLSEKTRALNDAAQGSMSAMGSLDRESSRATERLHRNVESLTDLAAGSIFAIASVVGGLVAFFITALIRLHIQNPMEAICQGIDRFSQGDMESRISLHREDEWGVIEKALNTMAANQLQSYTELEEANRELEAFVYTVSHDLRTPLTPIIGYAQILQESYGDQLDPDARDYLQEIEGHGEKMLALMEDLLALSKVGYLERPKEPVDLNSLLKEVISGFNHQLEATGLSISVDPLPSIRVPGTFLHDLFENLIGNALRYAAADGGTVEIGGHKRHDRVHLFVRDHGPGISSEERERVFEVFYRGVSGKAKAGTGVGLATVRKIARTYGGMAWIEETPGGGATVLVEMEAGTFSGEEEGIDPFDPIDF